MKRISTVSLIGFLFVVASARSATLATDTAPPVATIPACLPVAQTSHLQVRLNDLKRLEDAFGVAMDGYNKTSRKGIVMGSSQESDLNKKIGAVNQARAAYIAAVEKFNQDINARVRQMLAETGTIPALGEISEALPNPPQGDFRQRRAKLDSTRDSLCSRKKYFEEHCLVYSASEAKGCTDRAIRLLCDTESCIAAVKSFNWELEQAFGEERNRLEDRILEIDQALKNDVTAIKRFGFDRRAEDFEKWARISEETKHKVVDKLMEQVFEAGAEKMRDGIFEQLTSADNQGIDQMLLKLQTLGLGAAASADALRQYKHTRDKQLLRPIAKHLSEDLQTIVKFDERYQKGENFEAGLEALKFFLPPGTREVVSMAEMAAWATYGAGMQTVALVEVKRLNELTNKELLALQEIHCISERHILARYEAKAKLAALLNQNVSDVVKPVLSKSCSR